MSPIGSLTCWAVFNVFTSILVDLVFEAEQFCTYVLSPLCVAAPAEKNKASMYGMPVATRMIEEKMIEPMIYKSVHSDWYPNTHSCYPQCMLKKLSFRFLTSLSHLNLNRFCIPSHPSANRVSILEADKVYSSPSARNCYGESNAVGVRREPTASSDCSA